MHLFDWVLIFIQTKNCLVRACLVCAWKWFGTCPNGSVRDKLMVHEKFDLGYGPRPGRQFFCFKPPPHWRGSHNLEQTFLMFGEIREIPERGLCELLWRSLYQKIVRGRYFIVIGIYFFAILHLKKISASRVFFFVEPSPRLNIPFVYRIVLFYLLYLPQLKKSRENILQGRFQTSSWCSHWSGNVF